MKKENVFVWKNAETLNVAAAYFFVKCCKESIAKNGRFTVALSGGNTPKRLYQLLATPEFSKNIDWKKVLLFWGDERFVSHTHEDSNYKMVKENLLDKIKIPKKNIFPIPTKGKPDVCSIQYEQTLKNILGKQQSFDLTLLGMGNDGHTASLFPGTAILKERKRWVKEVWVAEKQTFRVSITYPLINRSKEVMFLIAGESKAPVLKQILSGKKLKTPFPVQSVQLKKGNTLVMADETAMQEF